MRNDCMGVAQCVRIELQGGEVVNGLRFWPNDQECALLFFEGTWRWTDRAGVESNLGDAKFVGFTDRVPSWDI